MMQLGANSVPRIQKARLLVGIADISPMTDNGRGTNPLRGIGADG
jgi:hypothetical protein